LAGFIQVGSNEICWNWRWTAGCKLIFGAENKFKGLNGIMWTAGIVPNRLAVLVLNQRDKFDSFVSLRSRLSQTKYMLPDIAEIEAEEIKYSKKEGPVS
jgi:hypothetical protein